MNLHGKNFIAGELSGHPPAALAALNPATGETLPPLFHEATYAEIDRACSLAQGAFKEYSRQPAERIARFIVQTASGQTDDKMPRLFRRTRLVQHPALGQTGREGIVLVIKWGSGLRAHIFAPL